MVIDADTIIAEQTKITVSLETCVTSSRGQV